MQTQTLRVPEVHCDHCVSSIEGALGGLGGVTGSKVSLDDKRVEVTFDEASVSLDTIKSTIQEQGYKVDD